MASSSTLKVLFFLAAILLLSQAPVLCRQLSENGPLGKEASKSSTQTKVAVRIANLILAG
jgi:hypothetical protein